MGKSYVLLPHSLFRKRKNPASIHREKRKQTNLDRMCKLSPEEFYDKIWWLYHDYGKQFTSTRLAVIAWLQKETEEDEHGKPFR